MNAAIVVPTIREKCIKDFLKSWDKEFKQSTIFIVEDNPSPTFDLTGYSNLKHFSWEDIEKDLGKNSWIIPRRTDCIRSYGYYKAHQQGNFDMIVTLDDDCYPDDVPFLSAHWKRLEQGEHVAWCETGEGMVTRGVPYAKLHRERPCVINHGMWSNVPDFDAPTQLVQKRIHREFHPINQTVPFGTYFPMCGMNLAFRPEVIPGLYFLLMGKSYEFDRFGDIWSGIIIKKICDYLGFSINSGEPLVSHQRASNVWENLKKEVPGLQVNEYFWDAIDHIRLTGSSFKECYREVARKLPLSGKYWGKLKRAMYLWTDLIESRAPADTLVSKS